MREERAGWAVLCLQGSPGASGAVGPIGPAGVRVGSSKPPFMAICFRCEQTFRFFVLPGTSRKGWSDWTQRPSRAHGELWLVHPEMSCDSSKTGSISDWISSLFLPGTSRLSWNSRYGGKTRQHRKQWPACKYWHGNDKSSARLFLDYWTHGSSALRAPLARKETKESEWVNRN